MDNVEHIVQEALWKCYARFGTYIDIDKSNIDDASQPFKYNCSDLTSDGTFTVILNANSWTIYNTGGNPTAKGNYQDNNIEKSILVAAEQIHSSPEVQHIETSSRTVRKFLGWSSISFALIMLKIFIICYNDDIREALIRSRIFVSTSGVTGVSNIITGTMLNLPTTSLCFIALILWILAKFTLPSVQFMQDTISITVAAMVGVPILLIIAAIAITDWTSRLVIILFLLILAWSEYPARTLNLRLEKWQSFARNNGSSISDVAKQIDEFENQGIPKSVDFNKHEPLSILASHSLILQRRLWEDRDSALESEDFQDAYNRAHILWYLEKNKDKLQMKTESSIERKVRNSGTIFRLRFALATYLPIFSLLLLAAFITLDRTPWSTPTCIESSDGSSYIAYEIPGKEDLVIRDSDRKLVNLDTENHRVLRKCSDEEVDLVEFSIFPSDSRI